jgi:putative DNA methylase
MHRTLKNEGILVIVFAHKSTAAWETILKALLDSNLVVTASWPIETEKPGRTRAIGSAALASSVFIVCRKRSAHDDGFVDDVEPALKERLHERLDYFWSQGIRGADFFMSAIGPAVEVFGHHKRVLKLSGEEVTIAELLDKVRGIVADYALQRIVHGEAAGNVDEASRFYVIWRWAFGTSQVESGEAIHMAQSMGCEFSELVADRGVLNKEGNKVSLKGPLDRKKVKGLGEPNDTGTLAPLVDVLHRAANLWAAGERHDLADFLVEALPPGGADPMQQLAQSIVDVLAPGDKERALYENFLVGSRSLPAPTKIDETSGKQQKLF